MARRSNSCVSSVAFSVRPGTAGTVWRADADLGQHFVWVDGQISHDARVKTPFDLGERDEQVLAGQQILPAPTRLVFGAGDHSLRALGQLREIEIEVFHRQPSLPGDMAEIAGGLQGPRK